MLTFTHLLLYLSFSLRLHILYLVYTDVKVLTFTIKILVPQCFLFSFASNQKWTFFEKRPYMLFVATVNLEDMQMNVLKLVEL